MKKRTILAIGCSILLMGISSCMKTTKGKVSNEWKVTAYTNSNSNYDSDGYSYSSTEKGGETSYSRTEVEGNTTSTTTGSISEYTYTFNKDGTWSSKKEYTVNGNETESVTYLGTEYDVPEITNTHVVEEQSGIWHFLGKNKTGEFKKNEKMVLTILKSSQSTIGKRTIKYSQIPGYGPDQIDNINRKENYDSKMGDRNQTVLIEESKRKLLKLKFSYKFQAYISEENYSDNYKGSMEMTLEPR